MTMLSNLTTTNQSPPSQPWLSLACRIPAPARKRHHPQVTRPACPITTAWDNPGCLPPPTLIYLSGVPPVEAIDKDLPVKTAGTPLVGPVIAMARPGWPFMFTRGSPSG